MGSAPALSIGDRRAGAHIHYVKSRRVLRLEGWNGPSERLTGVEVPLRTFLNSLDIDVRDVDLPRRYLIFAGQGRPRGGARDLTGVFDCEEEARSAFHDLRTKRRAPSSWAELIMLDHRGRTKALCWFEADANSTAGVRPRRVRPWSRRRSRPDATSRF